MGNCVGILSVKENVVKISEQVDVDSLLIEQSTPQFHSVLKIQASVRGWLARKHY
jgi:hypothetical protein